MLGQRASHKEASAGCRALLVGRWGSVEEPGGGEGKEARVRSHGSKTVLTQTIWLFSMTSLFPTLLIVGAPSGGPHPPQCPRWESWKARPRYPHFSWTSHTPSCSPGKMRGSPRGSRGLILPPLHHHHQSPGLVQEETSSWTRWASAAALVKSQEQRPGQVM